MYEQDLVNTLEIFQSSSQSIANATVWNEPIREDTSCYRYRYWGAQKDLVEKALQNAKSHIDSHRSPSISHVQRRGDFWEGYLTYWALGD